MRVISQDGTLDMPYEEVIIQRFRSRIYFLNKNLIGVESLNEDMQIAEYSTEEKAKKAMEMLRIAYEIMNFITILPIQNFLRKFAKCQATKCLRKVQQNIFSFLQRKNWSRRSFYVC